MTKWTNIKIEDNDFFKSLQSEKVRKDILARVVHWQLAKRRSGTHETKEEGDVRGSGKKMFRQKGTGNARQGSRRAPHMRGGAIIFGPHMRDYGYALPKKIRTLGLKSALVQALQNNGLQIFKDLNIDSFKTKDLKTIINSNFKGKKVLFVDDGNVNLQMGIRNIYGVNVLPVIGLNVYDILRHDVLVISQKAADGVKERVAKAC